MKLYFVGISHPDDAIPTITPFVNEDEAKFEYLSKIKFLTEDVELHKDELVSLTEDQKQSLEEGVCMIDGVLIFITDGTLSI